MLILCDDEIKPLNESIKASEQRQVTRVAIGTCENESREASLK